MMRPLDDLESLQVLQTLVKQRHESAEQFTKGGRFDLAEKEKKKSPSSNTIYQPPPPTTRSAAPSTKPSTNKAPTP